MISAGLCVLSTKPSEKFLKNLIPFILLTLILFSCKGEAPVSFPEGGKVSRIVSLSPSITAQIIDLESSDLIVGVTTYSPPLHHKVEIVGTLTSPNIEKIILLKPDAITYSIEDAAVQRTEQLEAMGIKLFPFAKNADYKTICENYIKLGRIIGKEESANKKLALYNKQLEKIKINTAKNQVKPSVAFFVSQEPLITVSEKSFINGIINDAGGNNGYKNMEKSYPMVSAESIIFFKPEIIISLMPDADAFFRKILSRYDMHESRLFNNIYSVNPDIVGLYTPANYLLAVKEVSEIISLYNKEKEKQ